MLSLKNVKKVYRTKNETIIATDNLDFEFGDKGFYIVLGKSGCGKTTLLNIMAGIDKYDEGHIYLNDSEIGFYKEEKLDEYRNIKVGIIFQHYNLITDMNVYDNLKIVLDIQKFDMTDKDYDAYAKEQISEMLNIVGLSGYEKRKINELSGGEQQRIAIARTLLKQPDVILADEPTGNLDSNTGDIILKLLKDISKKHLVIMVTHDKKAAYQYADIILGIHDGKIYDKVENPDENFKYSFLINETKYNDLSEDEVISVLRQKLHNNNKIVVDNIFKTKTEENDIQNQQDKVKEHTIPQNGTRKLTGRYKLNLSFQFLKKRKIRLLFTTFIFTLTAILMYFSSYISFYDEDEIIVDYFEKYNPAVLPVYTDAEYVDDFYLKQNNTLTKGKILHNRINDNLNNYGNKASVLLQETLGLTDEKIFTNATCIGIKDKNDCPDIAEGRKVNEKNEVVITDYIAKYLGVKVGDEIECLYSKYKVVGITETDYIEYNLKSKLNHGYNDEFFEYKCLYYYYGVYLLEENLSNIADIKKSITLRAADFCAQKNAEIYTSSYVIMADSEEIRKEDLLYGTLPVKENEVLVTEDYAEENEIKKEDLGVKQYSFYDIYNEKYNGYYDCYMNLYDYYKDGVIISGVVKSSMESEGEVFASHKKWETIKKEYFKYYYADCAVIPDNENYSDLVKASSDSKVVFDEPAVNKIYEFDNLIYEIKPVLYIIMILLFAVNIVLIATFIGISIGENTRNIGILRSLGVSMKNCVQIFNVEFVVMFIISMMFANMGLIFITKYVNSLFMENFHDVKFNIITVNKLVLLIVIIIEFIAGRISSVIPILKLKKKSLIDIIKSGD